MNVHLLFLAANQYDVEQSVTILEQAGCVCTWDCAATEAELVHRLATATWDIILAEHRPLERDSFALLRLAREHDWDTPIIVISNVPGEDVAVEMLKAGAANYVLLSRLERLPLVVERSLREHTAQRQQRRIAAAQRRLDEYYVYEEKMEAVKTLAGGFAHTLNNILTIILGNTQLILEEFPTDHPDRPLLTEIEQATRKASAFAQQMLFFGRRQTAKRMPSTLNTLVKDLAPTLHKMIVSNVTLDLDITSESLPIFADPAQIQQSLAALVVNACEAMPQGGQLRIAVQQSILDRSTQYDYPWAEPGAYALLLVSDSGVGMDAATQRRMFDPLFTTKTNQKGAGMSLAMTYAMIKHHNGFLHVASAPDRGTTVSVFLPLYDETA
jgi:signal transduction histidine kinase